MFRRRWMTKLYSVIFLFGCAAAAQAQGFGLSSGKTFRQGDPSTQAPDITIQCGANVWTAANEIHLMIPAGLQFTWDPSVVSVATGAGVSGSATANVHSPPGNPLAISYSGGNKNCTIQIYTDFAGLAVVISGLRFMNFTGPCSGSLTANSSGGFTAQYTDIQTLTVLNNPSISSGANYSVSPSVPPVSVTANPITITEASSNPGISGVNDLRITIPSGLNMTWDTSIQTLADGLSFNDPGGHMTFLATKISYPNSKTARINLGSSFAVNDTLQISGMKFAAVGADSSGNLIVTTNSQLDPLVFPRDANATDSTLITISGAPTLTTGAGPQAFTVGDPVSGMGTISVKSSPGSPSKIMAAQGFDLIIPGALHLEWDQTIRRGSDGLIFGGAGAAHVSANPLVFVVSYPDAKTAHVTLTGDFASNETLTIQGMKFTNVSSFSSAQRLTLNTTFASVSDTNTIAIGEPTLTSQIAPPGQIFAVNANPAVTAGAAPILVRDDAQIPAVNRITIAGKIRIRIPTTPAPASNLVFANVANVTCSGTAVTGGFMSATAGVSYEDGFKTAVITVANNWSGNNLSVTISGLVFQDFSVAMTPRQMTLGVNGSTALGGTSAASDKTGVTPLVVAIGGIPKLDSFSDKFYTFGDPVSDAAATITVTDAAGVPNITTAKDITIKIPGTLNLQFDTTRRTRNSGLSFNGTASGNVPAGGAAFVITYTDPKTAVIDVTTNFAAGDTLIIGGLRFQNFAAANAGDRLQLFVDPLGAAVLDSKVVGIGQPSMVLSADQSFGTGDASTTLNTVTITEDGSVARIKSASEIRIHIPPMPGGLDMTWDTTIQTIGQGLNFTGSGAGHVTTNVTKVDYPDSKTALIHLQSLAAGDFSVGQTLIIDGLKVKNFNSTTGPLGLTLEVNNLGTSCNTTPQKLSIGARPQLQSVFTADTNGNGSIDHLILTFDKNIATTSSVTSGFGFSILSPAYTIGAGSVVGNVVTFTLVERGTPDTGVTPSLSYLGGNLQDTNGLATNFTGPMLAKDGAAAIATGITLAGNAGGYLSTVTITFSETLAGGQEDIGDWRLIDADGSTNLLNGLTSGSVLISGNTVQFTLAGTTGTTGMPRYLYAPNANLLKIQDLAVPPNITVQQTNASPPLIHVGPDLAVGPSKVFLDASLSTDPNGQPLTFSWTNGSPFALQNQTTATPFFLGTTAGTYTFTLTVSNLLVSASTDVHVQILNVAPGADAGITQTVNPNDFVYLVALASSDANGPVPALSFVWSQLPLNQGGGKQVGVPAPVIPGVASFTAPTPSASLPTDNVLTFEVAVSDGLNTTKAQTQVRVNAAGGVAPTANAGVDQVATVGSTVTLDGSLSLDPAGGPLALRYAWTSTTPLSDPTVAKPTFVPALPGLYTFKLVVTNPNTFLSSFPSTVRILVQSATNAAPVSVAHRLTPTGEIVVGDLVVLDGTGSADPEGGPITYAWTQVAGPKVILADPATIHASFTPVKEALYTFQLIVSDGVNSSLPDQVTLTVKSLPNVVTFTATLNGGAGVAGNGHALLGAFSLAPGTSDLVGTWFFYLEQTGGPSAAITSAQPYRSLLFPNQFPFTPINPPMFTISPTTVGYYTFRLAATSFAGIRAFANIGVTVDNPPTDSVPSSLASGPMQPVTAGTLVTLDATGSQNLPAATFAGLTTSWVQVEGPPVALSDPYSAVPTFTPIAAGQYTFKLSVADATAQSSPSFVVVTVVAAPSTTAASGGSGGCGFLGLEGMLLLPFLWLVSLLGHGRRPRRQA
ncbi:MAG TPA: hypothetical protein VNM14_08280 [Planctomycetota bacterium]|nr:hypothetical protein [Planctomycetota bacterium]